MSVLDELREMVAWKFDNGTPNNGDIQGAIADFGAKHPGLIDKTRLCDNCGEPMPHYYSDGSGGPRINHGWSYMMTQVGEKYDPFDYGDDEGIWLLCPACTKDAA